MKTSTDSQDYPGGASVGTGAWGRVCGGRLTLAEQCRLAMQTVVAQLRLHLRAPNTVSDNPRRCWSRLDPESIELPDTSTVARALELVQESTLLWLCRHSLRTWSWAALLAQADDLRPDAEVLAISCLLHDLALLPTHQSAVALRCPCFAIEGGQRALLLLREHGWADARAMAVEEAICLHMNPRVMLDAGVEAHLLHEAAAMDVVGARMGEIDTLSRQAVVDRYPRSDFVQQMAEAMRQQADGHPTPVSACCGEWALNGPSADPNGLSDVCTCVNTLADRLR